MKRVKLIFWGGLVLISALWLSADTLLPDPFTYFSFRSVFVQYSGAVAIAVMSVAMVLSLRTSWLETWLGGLDKVYRLHKWLGIAALTMATMHWWFAKGTKWMVSWGWLEKPAKRARGAVERGDLEHFLHQQRHFAEFIGEWGFYLIAAILVVALLKVFSYSLFRKLHRVIPVLYIALVYHSIVLLNFDYWTQPIAWLLAILMVLGVVAGTVSLRGRIAVEKKVSGTVKEVVHYPNLRVAEVVIQLQQGWKGHQEGQFAFLTTSEQEGAHPFTIASSWNQQNSCITLIIKALGDHTQALIDKLQVEMQVELEGPYGRFNFEDNKQRQIWIGAGIGITPFVAKMKKLAQQPELKKIDLFHSTHDYQQEAIDKLTADAEAAKVELHLITRDMQIRLRPEMIMNKVDEWKSASIWFCGPATFGRELREELVKHGFPSEHFHQELFELR